MTSAREILVTHALPYANGPIHIGHLVESIQTDIWVRYQRMAGNTCHFVCADDAHGTPVMLRARDEGIPPEELIERCKREHEADYEGFRIAYDNYHTTHSDENRRCATLIYSELKRNGHIARKTIKQAYDPKEKMFLPDRFVKGQCPRCGAEDQYGDSCENCGATYSPSDLVNPYSVLSGLPPVERSSEHLFVKLGNFTEMLHEWVSGELHQPEVRNKLNEWFEVGLADWDISRDPPYFGFKIPDENEKYFYVWLDAPVGYMASFKNLCDREGIDFDAYWSRDAKTELYHFIGKDILYFHTLFWPAMLHGSGFRKPTGVFTHGFLTVNGTKMSKSRGTFVTAKCYLEHLDPDYLRYYYAVKLNERIEDIDLNLEDFVQRVNSDLIGKLVNIPSRCARFVAQRFGGELGGEIDDPAFYEELVQAGPSIFTAYEQRTFSRAMREIMGLADRCNQYVNDMKPWEVARQDDGEDKLHKICTQAINCFRVLMCYLAPVVPSLAERAGQFLNDPLRNFDQVKQPLLNHSISNYVHLLQRINQKDVDAMITASKESSNDKGTPESDYISIDDFSKIDLRTALVVEATDVVESDKLLRLKVDLGGETRQVFAGIKESCSPESLVGKTVIVVANLKPRKMRFGISEGMILAAGDGYQLHLAQFGEGTKPGLKIS